MAPSFGNTLYRYWFFGWLFRDVTRGNLLERAAAWRHNQASARWLPVYLRRWALLGAALLGLGFAVEPLVPPALQLLLYVPGAVSVPMNAVTLAAWIGLRVLPAPH